jgi:DNA-binding LacI/PurR family transcriptional regulator
MNRRAGPYYVNATLNDVAARCGVSYQTVSRVVNNSPLVTEKTRAIVLKAITELDYRPNLAARRLATSRSSVIGMVGTKMTYYGPMQVMVSVEETARRKGYNLMFVGVERPNKAQLSTAINDLCEHQVDGFVFGVRLGRNLDSVRKLCRGAPFVTLEAEPADGLPTVVVDQQYGVQLATRHLVDLGHLQIAHIAGPPGWSASKERRKGWAQTLAGADLEPGLCVDGDWSPESGYAALTQLLDFGARRFTAIVAANDHMALGAIRALRTKGIRVPEDISVVGYDDLPESGFFEPPLTTVHHDFARQGEQSVEVLLRMINREPAEPLLQLLRPELVVRESTAVPTQDDELAAFDASRRQGEAR